MEITETSKLPKSKNPKRVAAGKASAEKRAAQKAELEALRKINLEKSEIDPSEITKLCPVNKADKADKNDKPFKIPEKYVGLAYGFCFGLVGVGAFYYFSKSATESKKPINSTIPKSARTARTARTEPYDNPFDY